MAGTFYPADPMRLDRLVDTLLADAAGAARPPRASPRFGGWALLVPHAGLVYSGAIAALGLAPRRRDRSRPRSCWPARITRPGPTGVGVWTGGPWQTPLGEVPIDRDLAAEIAALGPPFAPDDDAHLNEHSLEVQLPLLFGPAPARRSCRSRSARG